MKLLLVVIIMVFLGLSWYFFAQRSSSRIGSKQNQTQEQMQKDLLLPDLRLSPPGQLYITINNGARKIRFTTSFMNQGKGPLEILGRSDPESQKTRATQKILKVDGTILDREIGEFVFHSGHDHWHIENYTLFELWSQKEDNERNQLLATTNKMSFCLWDEKAFDLTLENAVQSQKYIGCNNEVQGISVGWSDTYEADVEGQELDITAIPDGFYLVRSVVNPDRKILESDYINNEAVLNIQINGNALTVQNP